MKIIERIYKVIEYKGISVNEFSKKIDVSNGYLAKQRAVNANIGSQILEKIVSVYPEISPEWLLMGVGEMLRTSAPVAVRATAPQVGIPIIYKDGSVPMIPIEAIAGYTTEDIAGVKYEDCEHYQVPEFIKSGVEFVIRVSGSSMYPKYSNGDVLACKKVYNILFFQWGKVYVIDSSQGQLVKRVFEHENPDNILLVSDNKEKYPPFSIPKSDIRSLSIVLGVIRME
ncbi:MAG: hypothetical protein LBH92_03500 [Bacteroidales bacterium]|jgi:SOS-response transcriptional repressor LexA|nr:hypothetical protein [Bacteroidales bacterium]